MSTLRAGAGTTAVVLAGTTTTASRPHCVIIEDTSSRARVGGIQGSSTATARPGHVRDTGDTTTGDMTSGDMTSGDMTSAALTSGDMTTEGSMTIAATGITAAEARAIRQR
jgi:hypothetical protein